MASLPPKQQNLLRLLASAWRSGGGAAAARRSRPTRRAARREHTSAAGAVPLTGCAGGGRWNYCRQRSDVQRAPSAGPAHRPVPPRLARGLCTAAARCGRPAPGPPRRGRHCCCACDGDAADDRVPPAFGAPHHAPAPLGVHVLQPPSRRAAPRLARSREGRRQAAPRRVGCAASPARPRRRALLCALSGCKRPLHCRAGLALAAARRLNLLDHARPRGAPVRPTARPPAARARRRRRRLLDGWRGPRRAAVGSGRAGIFAE